MEKAIKIAIENGYENYPPEWNLNDYFVSTSDVEAQMIIDPLFWRALGRGLNWSLDLKDYIEGIYWAEYQLQWHRFIDHLASGGEIDKFFKDLTAGLKINS